MPGCNSGVIGSSTTWYLSAANADLAASTTAPTNVHMVALPPSPSPPSPSCPNASRRWLFSVFRRLCHHHHHLPRVQTRAGSGFFSSFQHASHHHHLPRVETRARGGYFRRFDIFAATTTSLVSKRELEVVLFGGFDTTLITKGHEGEGAKGDHDLLVVPRQRGGIHTTCWLPD